MLQNSCCASGLCSSASKPTVRLPAYQPQILRDASVSTVYSSAPQFQSEQDQAYQLGYNRMPVNTPGDLMSTDNFPDALIAMGNMSIQYPNAESKSHKPSRNQSSKYHQKRRQDRRRRHNNWSRSSTMESSDDDSDSSIHYSSSKDSTEYDNSEPTTRRRSAHAATRHSSKNPNVTRNAQLYARPPYAYPLDHPMSIPALPSTNFPPRNSNAYTTLSSLYPTSQYVVAPQIDDIYLDVPCSDCQGITRQGSTQADRFGNPYGAGEPIAWSVGTDGNVVPVAGDPRERIPEYGFGYFFGSGYRGDGF